MRKDGLFAALHRAVLKPKARDVRKNAWNSETTWRLVDERVSTRRDPARDQHLIWRLGHDITMSLKVYRRLRAEEAGEEVEKLLGSEPPIHREAWHRMKGWYQAAVDRVPPPARVTLKRITAERMDLYIYVPPPGDNIRVSVEPFLVDDLLPTENEIKWLVKRPQNNRSGGPSGMRAEHQK